MLHKICHKGVWECRQPTQSKGAAAELANSTVRLKISEHKVLSLDEATALRDRLAWQGDNEQVGKDVEEYEQMLDAIKAYNMMLVRLYLHGHREHGNTYTVNVDMRSSSAKDIKARHGALVNSLQKWYKGVERLRADFPALNFFTVNQLMVLDATIQLQGQSGRPEQWRQLRDQVVATLHFARPVSPDGVRDYHRKLEALASRGAAEVAGLGQRQLSSASRSGLAQLGALGHLLRDLLGSVPDACRPLPRSVASAWGSADACEEGQANLIRCGAPSQVLTSLITVYAPLGRAPNAHEVLMCDEDTSLEEVLLLLLRWSDCWLDGTSRGPAQPEPQLESPAARRYCLANVHLLSNATTDATIQAYEDVMRGALRQGRHMACALVVISGTPQSKLVSTLSQLRRDLPRRALRADAAGG